MAETVAQLKRMIAALEDRVRRLENGTGGSYTPPVGYFYLRPGGADTYLRP